MATANLWTFRSLPPRERILLLAQRQADRRTGQVERLAQTVNEIALVGVRHRVGAGAEQDEARRPALGLGDVVELETAAGDGRRRVRRGCVLEPTIERGGGNALVP